MFIKDIAANLHYKRNRKEDTPRRDENFFYYGHQKRKWTIYCKLTRLSSDAALFVENKNQFVLQNKIMLTINGQFNYNNS